MKEYLPWLYRWFRGEVLSVPGKVIAITFFTCLIVIPLISTDSYMLRVLTLAAIFSIYTIIYACMA